VTTSLVARYLACQVNKRFDAADAFPRRIEWMLSYLCQSLGHVMSAEENVCTRFVELWRR
jgi:hypothetical protein